MKILAIRGAGLASLAEPFEVDLAGGALGRAGVFAIVGPTGAGKSTLLDALFLALFGETPRLSSQPRTAVARAQKSDPKEEALAARDPRSLARSDVDQAYAEVDFTGVDGATYRARWDLKRKRRRDGDGPAPWRKAEHALSLLGDATRAGDLDRGQRLGGTKTEVLGHVAARLGLDFDEFRRSVVLAQGEIAAFLHAPDRDRAELLERMTGTEIYGELSREVHLETVRQRDRSERLEAQVAAIAPLDADARLDEERGLTAARIDALETEQARKDAESGLALYRTALELADEADLAETEVQRLRAQLGLAESKRGEIEAYERVQTLAPLLRAFDRAELDATESAARARAAEDTSAEARTRAGAAAAHLATERSALTRAGAGLDEARQSVSEALTAREAARPAELDAARDRERHRSLGAALAAAEREAERSANEEAAARRSIEAWAARVEAAPGIERVLSRAASTDGFAAEDLAARAAHLGEGREQAEERARLAEQAIGRAREEDARTQRVMDAAEESASAVRTRTQRSSARLAEVLRAAESEAPGAESAELPKASPRPHEDGRGARSRFLGRLVARGEVGKREASLHALDATARGHEGEHGALEHVEDARREVLVAVPTDDPQALLSRASACRARLLLARAEDARDVAQARQAAEVEQRARREEARSRTEWLRIADEITRSEALLAEAEATAAAAEARAQTALRAAHAHALRAHLKPGEPCEVCGATEHPHAPRSAQADDAPAEDRALREALEETRTRRDELKARALALRKTYSLLGTSEAGRLVRDPRVRADVADRSKTIDALERRVAQLDATLASLETRHTDLLEALARSTRAQQQASAARDERERARRALEDWTDRAARAAADLARVVDEEAGLGLSVLLEACRRDAATRDTRVARPPSAASRGRASRTPAADVDLLSFLKRILEERAAASLAAARLDLLTEQAALAKTRAGAMRIELGAAREDVARSSAASLLFTRAVAAFEEATTRELAARQALDRARQAHASAEAAHREADQRARSALAAVAHAEDSARAARERRANLSSELARALHDAGLIATPSEPSDSNGPPVVEGLARARQLAARSPAELAALRRELAHLDASRRDAEAVLAERKRRLDAHLAGPLAARMASSPKDLRAELRDTLRAQTAHVDTLRAAEEARRAELARCVELLRADDAVRTELAARRAELEAQKTELAVWEDLSDAFGSADGRKLRVYAQRLTLRALVREASHHLAALAPRYAIEAVPGGDLAIQVSDRALAGEVRAIGALSGGETFLVSLALALALRGMASNRVRIETLFIDEGFGALDAASLDVVLSALDALEASGRQVGIVSHVPEVKERFAARVEVVPDHSLTGGTGKSRVRIAV